MLIDEKYNLHQQLLDYEQKQIQERSKWSSKLENQLKAISEDVQYCKKMEKEKSQKTGWIAQIKQYMS
jgi:regulator of sirC expression with transglutaminase-like and TPR domain